MEFELAERMNDFEEGIFQILDVHKKKMQEKGRKIYNLSVGTPDFKPSKKVMEAVSKAALDPENYKYSLCDRDVLTDALKQKYKQRYGVELSDQEMMTVYGSQEGIAHIALALCDPGDQILVPDPGYPIFSIGPKLAGVKAITYELLPENNYLPDLDLIAEGLSNRVKAMIVSYPLNPIGKAAPLEFYEKLVSWAMEHKILIIHDNAYSDIIFDGRKGISILSIFRAKECCVEFYSLSKSFNVTGARIAFLVGNAQVVTAFKKVRSQIDYGMFLPIQYGAAVALMEDESLVKEQCRIYEERRNVLCGGLRQIGWDVEDSEGSMFVWAKLPGAYQNSLEFVLELIEKACVICTPGDVFGSLGCGHVRFALTLPAEQLKEAVSQIERSGIL
ncbi:MAG: aminotransferase class I/II-fold pyridoxal phosphate-dependent enzyme [Lachnospiraceae bacterium]|nr:aminotransferase class I/II-fold pyridoxal phosphate-dependent enzyme [Lachnospiraceae bacterium]MDD3659734.1 aminotransferase class I/II-fold pyridoxal phosphate-dependent enzyme [Lachnospiraceae bacterium]